MDEADKELRDLRLEIDAGVLAFRNRVGRVLVVILAALVVGFGIGFGALWLLECFLAWMSA